MPRRSSAHLNSFVAGLCLAAGLAPPFNALSVACLILASANALFVLARA